MTIRAEEVLGKIAVVGMSGRYPKAGNLEQFWRNLTEGRECISFYSDEQLLAADVPPELVQNPHYVKALGASEGTFLFDARFFDYAPREAEMLDPQLRVLMECTWESLENAGYDPWRYKGRIGLFVGSGATQYLFELLSVPELWNAANRFALLSYNDRDFLATQIGYKLNLRGPCITVQTACSTSLVAIVLACQSLLTYQSDIALAGGVTLDTKEAGGHLYQEGGVNSIDGHCRTFDVNATGIVGGCGAGVVVLKRLQDALADRDAIHAIVLGFGLNNDGGQRVGFTAPGVEGQIRVYADSIAMAGINPESIGFVECHGTGTPIGDPIELAALTKAFRYHTQKRNFCAIGSVKTNIGHTGAAAGVAGFTKAVLTLKNNLIPPTLHFHAPNPELELEQSPFYVNKEAKPWPENLRPRRAGITSLGAGGTNAHVILEEAPRIMPSTGIRPYNLIVLSAKTFSGLDSVRVNLVQHLTSHPKESLADLAYTLKVGRRRFPCRQFFVCRSDNAVETLTAGKSAIPFWEKPSGSIVFLFPGQGSQYLNMGKELYDTEPAFRDHIHLCAGILRSELDVDLCKMLYPNPEGREAAATHLNQIQYAQPALFAVEYALAKTWMKWGVNPECMVGHSMGEYTAACVADVFSLETALRLVTLRGRLMQEQRGAMTGVMLSASEINNLLVQHPDVSLAAINGPSACVVSGLLDAVTEIEQKFAQRKVPFTRLHVSCPAHSSVLNTILPTFHHELQKITLRPPKLPYISNLTGTWVTASEVTSREYWVRHLRNPVNFYHGIATLLKTGRRIFLEVGPGRSLTSLIAQYGEQTEGHARICSLPHPQDKAHDSFAFLLNAVGQLWLQGCDLDWDVFHAGESCHRIPLPTYPFERHYFRIDTTVRGAPNSVQYERPSENGLTRQHETEHAAEIRAGHNRPHLTSAFVAPSNELERRVAGLWQNVLGMRGLGIHDNFVELGGHSLLAIQLARRISEVFAIPFTVEHLYEAATIAEASRTAAGLLAKNAAAPEDQGARPKLGSTIVHQSRMQSPETEGTGEQQRPAYPGLQSPLVPIRATGSRQRLFLVHPGGGGIKVYQQLAKYLHPDQPIYAFQCHILGSHKGHPLVPVEEMAAHYVRALKQVQSEGPYLLAGWSAGGVIAFEMAVQLQERGEQVSLVVIFDAASRHHPTPEGNSSSLIEDILSTGESLAAREGRKFTLTKAALENLSEDEQLEIFLRELRTEEIVPPEVDAEALCALLQTFTNTNKALEYYIPRMYAGRVIVLRATEVTPELRELTLDVYDDPSFGWQRYCSQLVEVRYVPGDHLHIAVEPNIQKLGSVLQRCIDEVEKWHAASAQPDARVPL